MKRAHTAVIALVFALAAAPATAFDPLTLMVLRMLRDHALSAGLESVLSPPEAQPAVPAPPGNPHDLNALVNESFPQLDPSQRLAVRERLEAVLNDPEYAGQRELILDQFIEAASAAKRTHQALARLSAGQKREIAARAAAAYRTQDPQALQQAIAVLRSSAAPIPSDLRELMLAEFTAASATSQAH